MFRRLKLLDAREQTALAAAAAELEDIQRSLHAEATMRRDAQIERGVTTLDGLADYFAEGNRYPGWVELGWSRPTGAAPGRAICCS